MKVLLILVVLFTINAYGQSEICSYCDSLQVRINKLSNDSLLEHYSNVCLKPDTSFYFNSTKVANINESNNVRISFTDYCGKEKERRVISTHDLLLSLHNIKMGKEAIKAKFECGYWCVVEYFKKYNVNGMRLSKGFVLVSIHVDENGKVFKAPVINSSDELLEEYVREAILSMPNWTPGSYKGKAHPSFETFAFVF